MRSDVQTPLLPDLPRFLAAKSCGWNPSIRTEPKEQSQEKVYGAPANAAHSSSTNIGFKELGPELSGEGWTGDEGIDQ
jgi:hypothetical protein